MRVDEFIPSNVMNVLQGGQNNQNANGNNNISFGNILEQQLSAVNDKQVDAENTTNQFVAGDDIDVHQVMLSTEEAKLSLDLAIQVRNKLVDAYQELNRTQI
ncbi:flagellar hook-basal body complex protein FliE [Clostridium hydrogenum]|uniref:flagellar hook-basal body complex protein FliE n=1 Tax=Clostridium hydrogenum TaxID=2855764 RepID=UPI001F1EC2D1|nr:flagellar hook-basal body complex protein FliE [Clostridium hydrogenum]